MDEERDNAILLIDSLFTCLWGFSLIIWLWNNRLNNSGFPNSLTTVLTVSLILKFLYHLSISTLLFLEDETDEIYSNLITSTFFSVSETLKYTSLLLISQGYFITRIILERSEIPMLIITITAIYLSCCAYSLERQELFFIMISVLFVLFVLTLKYTLRVLRILRMRSLQLFGISPTYQDNLTKTYMMNVFLWTATIFFLQTILNLVILQYWDKLFRKDMTLELRIIDRSFEFCCLGIIFCVFRAKSNWVVGELVSYPVQTYGVIPYYYANRSDMSAQIMVLKSSSGIFVANRVEQVCYSYCSSSSLEEPLIN